MLIVLAVFTSISGCVQQLYGNTVPPGKFVFIEHSIDSSGYLIEGSGPYGPDICDDFYYYDANKRALHLIDTKLDNRGDFIAILGEKVSASGAAGSGSSAIYYAENKTPFEYFGVKVTRIEANGTCAIEYGGRNITLKPGENWSGQTSAIRERPDFTNKGVAIRANITTVDTITNYGLLNKSDMIS